MLIDIVHTNINIEMIACDRAVKFNNMTYIKPMRERKRDEEILYLKILIK